MRKREAYEVEFKARSILGLKQKTPGAMSGVGGVLAKAVFGFNTDIGRVAPDAWFLPENRHNPAIIAICVPPDHSINKEGCYSEQLLRTCLTAFTGADNYDKMIGIVYNGEAIRVFKSAGEGITELENETELKPKEYYLGLWEENKGEVK